MAAAILNFLTFRYIILCYLRYPRLTQQIPYLPNFSKPLRHWLIKEHTYLHPKNITWVSTISTVLDGAVLEKPQVVGHLPRTIKMYDD